MAEIYSYHTIHKASEGLFKDRGSKFLAFAYPVQNEEEVKLHLNQLRKQHAAARHHCYAWRLGPGSNLSRANDDGEPSNSAGKPILTQIQFNELYHVLIVVIRYFGGTLLGVNGLINAYKLAATDALKNSTVTEHFILNEYQVSFEAGDQGMVMRILKENQAKLISNTYNDKQHITFHVKKQEAQRLEAKFKELYKSQIELLKTIE